jgi:Putative peptidoglycan binding domain
LNSPSFKPGGLPAALMMGVCLAATSLCPAQSPTPKTTKAPASKKSATTTGAHPVAKATATPRTTHRVAGKTTHARAITASARRHAAHSTARASSKSSASHAARRTATVHSAKRRSRKSRPLTAAQRLARLHLAPERVSEIQQALNREGYLKEEPNGQWDARTREAMQRYQTAQGFPATGLPEAKSLMKLGLGSHPLPADLDPSLAHAATPEAGRDEPSSAQSPPRAYQEVAPQQEK